MSLYQLANLPARAAFKAFVCSFYLCAHYVSWKEGNTNKNTRQAVQPRTCRTAVIGQTRVVLSREVANWPITVQVEGTLNKKSEQLKQTRPAPAPHYHLIANSNFHVLQLYFIKCGITSLLKHYAASFQLISRSELPVNLQRWCFLSFFPFVEYCFANKLAKKKTFCLGGIQQSMKTSLDKQLHEYFIKFFRRMFNLL